MIQNRFRFHVNNKITMLKKRSVGDVKIDSFFHKKPKVEVDNAHSSVCSEVTDAANRESALESGTGVMKLDNENTTISTAAPVDNIDIGTIAGKSFKLSETQRQSILQCTWVPEQTFKFPARGKTRFLTDTSHVKFSCH